MTLADHLRSTKTAQVALAARLGVSQGLVSHWVVGRLKVPADRVLAVVRATGGAVRPHDLRPDIYPDPDWMPPLPPPDGDAEAAA